MSKIKKITLSNFKAIKGTLEADFKGCTAIITAGNNKGKTSFLRGIPDRMRFTRPEIIVNDGEESGKGEMILTTGEKFLWDFDVKGKDKLTYITTEGLKVGLTKEIGEKFFPALFDIDKFLMSTPKKQTEQLQQILGVDFTDIDARYKFAYDDRTEKNRESEKYHVKLGQMIKCDKVEPVDLTELQTKKEAERTRLNELYKTNKAHNDKLRKEWEELNKNNQDAWNATCRAIDKECNEFNNQQQEILSKKEAAAKASAELANVGFIHPDLDAFVVGLNNSIKDQRTSENEYPKQPEPTPAPAYIQELPDDTLLKAIDNEILSASETNAKAKAYADYIAYAEETKQAKIAADNCQKVIEGIELERKALLESAKMPEGISITPNGITVDGLPLDRSQLSTSKLYMAALRIAAMNLGQVKTLHFDASFLDKNSLSEIEAWAHKNDLQLLIERPDFEGGEFEYQIIEQ